jgi:nucleotide-binding universal stress UspA family protein
VESVLHHYNPSECTVLVLHAVDALKLMPTPTAMVVAPFMLEHYLDLRRQWTEEGEKLVARTAAQFKTAGFTVTQRVEEGDATRVIHDAAEQWKADLILLGSHGRHGLDRLLLGTVSEAVARNAPCSVEIVRAPARAA